MLASLGTIQFDGLKSFSSWSEDQEVAIVEHSLIGRAPLLEGTGLGLKNLSLSIYLHAEFCKPEEEINKLRTALTTFEILPLLLGNGKLVGEFVLQQMSVTRTQMDKEGNTFAATVSLTLKESVEDNKLKQKQQEASDKAFANGDKKPAVKSTRVNDVSCNNDASSKITTIKSYASVIDKQMRYYTSTGIQNVKLQTDLSSVLKLLNGLKVLSCVASNTNLSNQIPASILVTNQFKDAVNYNQVNAIVNIPAVKTANVNFQAYVKELAKAASSNIQKSATRNG